jgi:hypothetical protein
MNISNPLFRCFSHPMLAHISSLLINQRSAGRLIGTSVLYNFVVAVSPKSPYKIIKLTCIPHKKRAPRKKAFCSLAPMSIMCGCRCSQQRRRRRQRATAMVPGEICAPACGRRGQNRCTLAHLDGTRKRETWSDSRRGAGEVGLDARRP